MITRLLTALLGIAESRPRLVLLVMMLPGSMTLYAFVVPLDLSFGGFMSRDDPEVARYFEASRSYGLGGWLPLLLGLGVDNGIHVAHRMQEEPNRPLDAIVDSVGAAIAMTTLTTCASVATLLFSRHPGIESVAILLLVGLPLCMLASVTVLPALAIVLRVRRSS